MTPKEKAEERIKAYSPFCEGNSQTLLNYKLSIRCALKEAEQILEVINPTFQPSVNYWKDVKTELERKFNES